jgi:arylsulfatase A-like enzyme
MNVVCICLDTFRADIVGPGKKYSHAHTPNLDALAADSIRFTRAFGECQPTLQMRRALFTGMRSFPFRYNFDRRGQWPFMPGWHKIPPGQETIAEVLLARGYLTALIADTYHMFKPTANFSRGFAHLDFVRGQETDNWRSGDPRLIEEQLRRHVREPIDWPRHARVVNYLLNQRRRQSEDDYSCARVFRAACDWLQDNHTMAPFFLWIDSFDPHEPFDPPKAYADRYCPGYEGKDFIVPNSAWEGGDPTEEELRRIEALYLGEVTFVDKWVGVLLNKLDELRLGDDTLVVFLTDHGTQLRDRGGFGKSARHLHPFITQLNLTVRHPGGPDNRDVTALVQNHDLMPTILSLLEIPCGWTDGENLWPLVTGQKSAIRERIITGWADMSAAGSGRGRASVRDDRWNFCTSVGFEDEAGDELFDLSSDPEERHNVAGEHTRVVADCRAELEALIGQPLPGIGVEHTGVLEAPMVAWLNRRLREW